MSIFGKKWAIVVAVVIIVGGILAGKSWWSSPSPASTPPARPLPEVSFVVIQPQRQVMTVELAGRTSPYQIAEIRPQVGGIIQKRLFREGADLKAGDPLYQIDPRPYKARYESAKAQVAKSEAMLDTVRHKSERFKKLADMKAISLQDYEDALSTMKQAEADVAGAKAAMDAAAIDLAYTEVRSPIDGRIGLSAVTVGALVNANQSAALATVQQLDPIYVDLTQSISDMMRLKKEMAENGAHPEAGPTRVTLILEDGSHYPLSGRLEFTDVTVDRGSGSVLLRAVFPNPDPKQLLPGMFVRALVETGVRPDAILVPQQGVARDAKGSPTALVLNADDKVELKELRLSSIVGDKWVVESGLKPGDRVIVEGQQKVAPGAPAKGVPFTAQSASATQKP